MMSPKLIVGGALVGGLIAAVAFAGDGESREPWTKPIALPENDDEMLAVKHAICTCFRGGVTDLRGLAVCSLKQVYADVPWEKLTDTVEGDHASVAKVRDLFFGLSAELLKIPNAAGVDQWCGNIVPPPPPEKPDIVIPADVVDDDEEKKKRRLELWDDLSSDVEVPGSLFRIAPGHKGIQRAAENALKAAGADLKAVGSFNALTRPYMLAMSQGPKWNRNLYARTSEQGEWWASDGKVIGPAWLPRNADARAAILLGHFPARTITATGAKLPNVVATNYGVVWLPKVDADLLAEGVLSIVGIDPPQELLDLLA